MNKKYNCNICNYHSDNLCNFNKHLSTKKHNSRLNSLTVDEMVDRVDEMGDQVDEMVDQKIAIIVCDYCNIKLNKKKYIKKHLRHCKEYKKYIIEKEKKEKEEIINKLMEALKKEQEKNKQTELELHEKSIELHDVEKEYMDFMRQVAKQTKMINNIKSVNMYFIQREYTDALNYPDLMNLPLTDDEIRDVKQYGGVQGCYDIIYGRCIDGIDIEKRPLHCVDDSRSKYLLRIKDKWKIDKKGAKILEAIYPKIVNICVPEPQKINSEYSVWKEQNTRMNELANGKQKIIKMLNDVTLIKNTIAIEE